MAENGEHRSEEQSKPPAAPRPPAPAGDQVAVNVGEGAAHVAAGKNIIQIGSLTLPRWAALLIVLSLAAMAVLAGVIAYYNRQTSDNTARTAIILGYTPTPASTVTSVPTATPTAPPFAPAAEGETLIVVLPFHSTAATNSEPHKKIWRAIDALLQKTPGGQVRAAIDPNVVLTADQQAEAERVGKLHNAGMVIWGEDTGVEIIAGFLNLREPDFDAADVDIQETERTQLANPSRYAEFVTRDLPGQMAFLSLFAVGQSYYLNNDYAAAIDTIEAAVSAAVPADGEPGDGQDLDLAQGLAEAYFRLGWLHQQPPADLDAALADYSKAIELDPQDVDAYNNRGLVYYDQGDMEQAIADYNKAIELDPQYANAYYNRGNVYYRGGDLDQAIADYSKTIELDPQHALAYNNRGVVYYDQGDLEPALADYNKAIELDPQYVDAYNNRGAAYYEQGDLDQALADYSKTIELDSQYANAYYNRGSAYYDQGDLEHALADLRKATELNPQDAEAHNDLCWTLASLDQAQEAIGHCEQATALADEPTYMDSRGLARALLGDYAAAAADFQTYVDWLEANAPDASSEIEQRQAWIEALKRGQNPFTPAVLAELRGG